MNIPFLKWPSLITLLISHIYDFDESRTSLCPKRCLRVVLQFLFSDNFILYNLFVWLSACIYTRHLCVCALASLPCSLYALGGDEGCPECSQPIVSHRNVFQDANSLPPDAAILLLLTACYSSVQLHIHPHKRTHTKNIVTNN